LKHNILLAFSFARRDFKERYFGTGLGQFWYLLFSLCKDVIMDVKIYVKKVFKI